MLENYLRQEKDVSAEERLALLLIAQDNFKAQFGKSKAAKQEFTNYLKTDPYYNSALVKYGYAMTCHRANGLRWKNIFINCETEKSKDNEEYFRWIYTALSCATARIHLIDFSDITPYSKIEWKERLEYFDRMAKLHINIFNIPPDLAIPSDLQSKIDNLKFPPQFPTLPLIWYLILNKLSALSIQITQVDHSSYQEIYSFKDEAGITAKIRFYYNGEGKITRHVLAPKNQLSERIINALESSGSDINLNFSTTFLQELYLRLVKLAAGQGIEIVSLQHEQHHERYSLKRGDEFIQLAFYYKDDGFVSTVLPIKFNSHTLYQKVKDLVQFNLRLGDAHH